MVNSWPKPKFDMCIYALVCPFTNEIKYIGKTKNGVKRIKGHWRDFKKSRLTKSLNKKQCWVKHLKKNNIKFLVKYLDYANNNEELCQKEIYWISFYKNLGVELLNCTEGGEQVVTHIYTEEEKKEISKRTKQAMWSPEVRQRYLDTYYNRTVPKNYKSWSTENKQKHSNTVYANKLKKQVIDEFGNIFSSLKECAKHFGTSPENIGAALKNKRKVKNVFIYLYKDAEIKTKEVNNGPAKCST